MTPHGITGLERVKGTQRRTFCTLQLCSYDLIDEYSYRTHFCIWNPRVLTWYLHTDATMSLCIQFIY
jgi:hypothetical protein